MRSISLPRRRVIHFVTSATLMLAFSGCRPVPQVVDDEGVHKELDALYTAVTSRRRNLVDECHERLKTLHKDRQLSDVGFTAIAAIIKKAEDGKWADAAQHLHDFMRAQRKSKNDS